MTAIQIADPGCTPGALLDHVVQWLQTRGSVPLLTPESRDAAEHAAATLLVALGVPVHPATATEADQWV